MKDISQITQRKIRRPGLLVLSSVVLIFHACSSCQSDTTQKNDNIGIKIDIDNEDVQQFLEKEINASAEDEQSSYSVEQRNEVRATQEKRSQIISEEMMASSFKDKSDEEIMAYLSEELERYQSTCDTAVFNGIRRLMNRDARIKVFRARQIEFSEAYGSQIKEAMEKCKSPS